MGQLSDRREFIKNSALLGTGLLLFNGFSNYPLAKALLRDKFLQDEKLDIMECINPNFFVDDYISGQKLIIAHDYVLSEDISLTKVGRENIVIYCNNLFVNGKFDNPEGNIHIFCNTITSDNGIIDLSGRDAIDAGKELSANDGDYPDGKNADNIDPTGQKYNLDGGNGGQCILHFNTIKGKLEIYSNGGKGGKGEDGGDAINGRDGYPGNDDNKCDDYCIPKGATNGGDGVKPGNNGNGDDGGKGGNGGLIYLCCKSDLKVTNQNSDIVAFSYEKSGTISCNFQKGEGGMPGLGAKNKTNGGHGGPGGVKWNCTMVGATHQRSEPKDQTCAHKGDNGRANSGKDRSSEHGALGNDGKNGVTGIIGKGEIHCDIRDLVNLMPSSFIRLGLIKAEYYYINNKIDDALSILQWLLEIKKMMDKEKNISYTNTTFSPYLENESIDDFKPLFIRTDIYLNQINLKQDFFGNTNNYITLLNFNDLDDKIMKLKPFINDSEKLTIEICEKAWIYSEAATSIVNQKNTNLEHINRLNIEIENIEQTLLKLNDEIIERQNQISDYKSRIISNEKAFEKAVESFNQSPSQKCTLSNSLTALSSVVAIASGVGAGLGAVSFGLSVASDISNIKNDFISKVDKLSPGINATKWKTIFNSGNNNLISQINKIKGDANSFTQNIEQFRNTFLNNGDKNQALNYYSYDINDVSGTTKEKFIEDMNKYIDKFPEAKIYEDEVISFMDFCDLTNRKRLEFTNDFLLMRSYQEQISSLEAANSNLSEKLDKAKSNKIGSSTKVLYFDAYLGVKRFYLWLIYLHHKALNYYTLSNNTFSMELFEGGIDALSESYVCSNEERLIQYNNNKSKRQPHSTPKPIIIKLKQNRLSKDVFINGSPTNSKNHTFTFYLEPDKHIYLPGGNNWSEIFVEKVMIKLNGAKTNSHKLGLTLKHFGDSKFFTSDKKEIEFSHPPFEISYDYDLKTGKPNSIESLLNFNFKSNDEIDVSVSPFAHWSLSIDEDAPMNEGLDLKHVDEIELLFGFIANSFS